MRRWSFVAGAVLIVLGVFALFQVGLDALGIHFRIWWIFWPLVLIGIGAWVVTGVSRRGITGDFTREDASVPLDGAGEASVTVHHGAGRLSIGAGAGGGQLLSGTFGGGLDASRRMDGGRLVVDMRMRDRGFSRYWVPWSHGWSNLRDWDFTMNPDVPVTLNLETGASESRLNLTDLKVTELRLSTGASATYIDLPARAGYTKVSIESGAASVKMRVPNGVAAKVQVRSALAGIHVDRSRFPASAGGYQSRDWDSAPNKLEILIETGVGSVDVY